MSDALSIAVLAAAMVVAVAGIAKLARPRPTAIAMRQAGFPDRPVLATLLGLGELILAAVVIGWVPSFAVAILAALYFLFACFCVVLLRRTHGAASCGCFGAARTPVHVMHVALNLVIGVVLATAAIMGVTGSSVITIGLAVPCAACLVLCFTLLPEVLVAARREGADSAR